MASLSMNYVGVEEGSQLVVLNGIINNGKDLSSGLVEESLVEKLSFVPILHQFRCIIPNIHVTLDISCHFGQCHKRPCFLLVNKLYYILHLV